MRKPTITLLRAAYIAVLLDNEYDDMFSTDQLKILRVPLRRKRWPVSVEKDSELAREVNDWFESNFVETVRKFPDSDNPEKLEMLTNLIRLAVGIPRSEIGIIRSWIPEEMIIKLQSQADLFDNKKNNENPR